MVTFGLGFIANSDLTSRFRNCLPLNAVDSQICYTQVEEGYTDDPSHNRLLTLS